ncbi:unnamed protein product [Prunus brigantina]
MNKPWQNALIIKLLGRSHTYNYLHDRLQQKWSLNGGWKLVDLVNDYFVVKFEVEEDLNYVLTEGPWIIAGQYLTMQKWRSGFCPSTASITRMAVWIRVSAIQLECFDVWALKRIGNLLGKLLKIDAHTTSQNRGKFARLCVELDLTKPLEAFVQINQVWYNIEYEGLPEICYNCGLYGHKRENCLLNAKSNLDKARSSQDDEVLGDDAAMSKEDNFINKEGLRGPWMNVPPRRRPKVSGNGDNGQGFGNRNQGSRFAALRQVGENFGSDNVKTDVLERQPPLGQVFDSLLGPKVWTKSKGHKAVNKSALKDISNQSRGSDSGVDEDSLAPSVAEEECPITTMDLSEGQVSQKPWLFSAIYARPCSVKKAKLWEYLNFVASCHQMPWLLAGDFNDILQAEDKVGGVSLCRVTGMKKWFDANNMIDLGFSGPRFTWTNRRVFERIDRAICNEKWRSLFADANQWGNFVGSAWEKSLALVQPLKHWNIHVFGHLRQTKARLLARLAGIQRSLSRGPNRFLSNLEVTLVEEFNLLLEQEALFWQQKSRVKWLQEGDRNTKFFHLTTIIRRRRNKIERLKDENDVWVEESEAIKSVVVKYFSDLFKSRQCLQCNVDIPQLFPCIDDADVAGLVKSVDLQEVKDSLFGIGGIKAPGVDGYPACFYQNQWSLCAGDIFDLVSTVFSTCIIPEKLNTTWITLVPKVPNPSSMVHFRPISLCCTLYKASTKQAQIMRECLEKFCSVSGQAVNFDKSAIFCSPNTGNVLAQDISRICGSPLTENLGNYLGMPILHNKVFSYLFYSCVYNANCQVARQSIVDVDLKTRQDCSSTWRGVLYGSNS